MASSNSEAKAKVTLDSTSFEKGAKAVASAAVDMGAAVVAAFAVAGVAVLAAFGAQSVSAIVHSTKEVLELGEQMANAGHKAGIAAGQFYLFTNAVDKGLSLKTVANLIGDNAAVLDKSANVFRDVTIKLWAVGERIKGFWLGFADQIAPVLSQLLDGALGISLVNAGKAFGEILVDAVKVVYQMFTDGDLWKNIATLGVATFEYIANIFSGLLEIAVNKGFEEVFTKFASLASAASKWFGENLGLTLEAAVIRFAGSFLSTMTTVFGKLVSLVNGYQSDIVDSVFGTVSEAIKTTSNGVSNIILSQIQPKTFNKEDSALTQIKDLFANTKFEIPNVGGESTNITDVFKKYLDEFNTAHPAFGQEGKQYENNSRRAAFGADSLAAIGAGGNVSLGLSVLDVNKLQLAQLQQINAKLGGSRSVTPYQNPASSYISRSQTTDVVGEEDN